MKRNEIWQDIEIELRQSKKMHPNWPDHLAAQVAKISVQVGQLTIEALDVKYPPKGIPYKKDTQYVKLCAIRTAVAAIRFLENLKE